MHQSGALSPCFSPHPMEEKIIGGRMTWTEDLLIDGQTSFLPNLEVISTAAIDPKLAKSEKENKGPRLVRSKFQPRLLCRSLLVSMKQEDRLVPWTDVPKGEK